MTVAEFARLPKDDGPVYHELRRGIVTALPRPILRHQLVQGRLRDLLKRMAALGSYIETNLPYRALPEYELRVADVGYVSSERWSTIDVEDYVPGAPDLVIEVLSPSNSVAEMIEREQLCLENGAQEFWVVDPKRRLVKVSTPDGHTRTWKSGQQIPLPLFAGKALPVDDIFS